MQVQSHDAALRARAVDTLESLRAKHLLTTQENSRVASRRSDRPPFDRKSAFAARQVDCCGDQRMGDATAAMLSVDEQTGDQPHQVVLVAWPSAQQPTAAIDGSRIPRPWATGTPAGRAVVHQRQHTHRVPARRGELSEPSTVSATEPACGELTTVGAERSAPTMPRAPADFEQAREVGDVGCPYRTYIDFDAHIRKLRHRAVSVADHPTGGRVGSGSPAGAPPIVPVLWSGDLSIHLRRNELACLTALRPSMSRHSGRGHTRPYAQGGLIGAVLLI